MFWMDEVLHLRNPGMIRLFPCTANQPYGFNHGCISWCGLGFRSQPSWCSLRNEGMKKRRVGWFIRVIPFLIPCISRTSKLCVCVCFCVCTGALKLSFAEMHIYIYISFPLLVLKGIDVTTGHTFSVFPFGSYPNGRRGNDRHRERMA